MLRLLLQPPRSLCASTGHYPHFPFREPVQPATARVPWSRDKFPRRTQGTPKSVAFAAAGSPCILYPSFTPAWVSQSPRISCLIGPVWAGTDALRRRTHRGGAKSKAEPQELCKQRTEREISPSSLRSSGLNPHSQLEVPFICGIPE